MAFEESGVKASMARAVLTDVHFWVPVVVLIAGAWLLMVFAVSP